MRCAPALCLLLAGPAALAQPADPADPSDLADPAGGTANLPLAEVLRLHADLARAQEAKPRRAPVAAVVEKMELAGMLLDDAAELSAHVEARVFDEGWAVLPLVRKDPQVHVLAFPRLEAGTLSTVDLPRPNGQGKAAALGLVTQKTGPYAFDVGLRVQAKAEGRRRSVKLALGPSTLASLKIKYDPGLFRLQAKNAIALPDGALIFPEEGGFELSWEPTGPAALAKREDVKRPAVEAVVERAHASVVSTLAGKRITRVLFELKLEGARPIQIRIPEGYALERAFVNGAARELAAEAGVLRLEAQTERAGDARGRLELLLAEEPGRFKLSGGLRFQLPAASWRTDEYVVELHLPEVFNYQWKGGSLSPCDAPPRAADFVSQLPTPGKQVCLRQALAFEPPTAEVAYAVDLAGKYWAGR